MRESANRQDSYTDETSTANRGSASDCARVVPRRVGWSAERGLKRGSGAQVGTEGFGLRGDTAASRGTFRAFGVVSERHATNESAEVARALRDHGRAVRGRVLASFDVGTRPLRLGRASGVTVPWSALPVGVVSERA